MDKFTNLDETSAKKLLRTAHIDRQTQSGSLDPNQIDDIQQGKMDQSIGFEDASYALQNVERLWDKSQQADGGVGSQV